ncbi:GIR2 Protein GIR2 [Candida maltosa Xu316]|uniref:RWD domain-containing protein n=1 Tax=Candida maltosa (strain Xu316) TaxID=1245528 RepID=M3JZ23_CANMX|nr:hypothetical protein G210_1925 [Candida maltosa Xu316]
MDPLEEQQQELEVLQSIYPDELVLTTPSNFNIRINLDVSSTRKHSLILFVKYPETYPEVIPILNIEVADQDDNDEDNDDYDSEEEEDEEDRAIRLALNMAETIDFEKPDILELLNKLNIESEMNLGFPVIFNLITILKDEAELLFENKLKLKNREYEEKRKEQELLEQKKFQGTKVTKESWSQWRDAFRKEMDYEKHDQERFKKMHNGKLTGKQIFEQGLANDNEDGEEEEVLIEGVKKI